MKRLFAVILTFALIFSATACSGKDSADNTVSSSDVSSSQPAEVNHDSDPEYIKAVKAAYDKVCAENADYVSLSAYMTDLNGDGYKDIIYQPYWFPYVMIYYNGKFVDCEIESEVVVGSIFPSGKESGYFIDSEKGIIVIRYDSHTTGTVLYRGAEAFQIEGTNAKSLWIEYYDSETHNGVEDYMLESEEYIDQVYDLVDKEFDEKQYNPRIKDYNLVNYYDVSSPWDGSVISEPAAKSETSTTSAEKIEYLKANNDDYNVLSAIIQDVLYNGCWPDGFNRNNSDVSIFALVTIVDVLYGTKIQNPEGSFVITNGFQGLTDYNFLKEFDYDYEAIDKAHKDNRKLFDPLFKFDEISSSYSYYSANAETIEWIEQELLGGNIDRNTLIEEDVNGDIRNCCYYCDGSYYFQVVRRNGRIPQISMTNSEQLEDGRYTIVFNVDWYDSFTAEVTADLIEKDGRNYWRLFSIA